MGIVIFAITIGVGVVVLTKFGDSVGGTANTTVQSLITDLGLVDWLVGLVLLLL